MAASEPDQARPRNALATVDSVLVLCQLFGMEDDVFLNLHRSVYLEGIVLSSDIGCADEFILVSIFMDKS